jgi:hypothetical protein
VENRIMDFLSQLKGSKFLSRGIDRRLRDTGRFQPGLESLEERAVPAMTIGVNATANVHPISPLIYGAAYASTAQVQDLNLTINRDGGNASDTYNWQADATNHGSDWYYESLSSGSGNGQGMDSFVSQAKAGGAAPDLTLDIMPYAANLNSSRNPLGSYPTSVYGAQQSTDPWWPSFGNGVTTSGQKITDTNPLYNYINNTPSFEQSWIQHLISTFGNSQNGGVGYYTFGNEPALWNSTHRDIHPNGETNTELLNDYINYGTMLKALDPNARIVGPEEWGWTGYLIDGADAAVSNWGATYGGLNVEQWFLQQLQQYQTQHGVRLLDYFTNHIYPQASNVFSNATDQNTELLRNATTRDFWDPNYVDPSWINQPIYLIPRMQSWVNTYYPGTRVGITEYNWGAEGDMNGATAQADIYGIFGAQGLDLGERWTTPSTGSPTYLAMKLWRNYDGSNHGFGDTSVSASVGNPDQVDAFAATRSSDGALTVAVINKNLVSSGASTTITINLSNFNSNGVAQVWQLAGVNGSTTNAAITHLSDISFSGNTITVTVPNESVTMFVLMPGSATSAPKVTTNPTGQTVTAGQSVSFVAAATGSPTPTVQWQVSTNSGSTWTNIAGAASTTYTFTTSTSQSGSQYRAVFTNSAGSAITSAATLTVNAAVTAPSITTQPASQTVNAGQSVSFTVATTGTAPLTYQWQKMAGSTWGNVGTNSATFTISAAATSDTGSYHVIVSNSAGSVTSNTVTLTVNTPASLPAPWTDADIGSPGLAGSASLSNGVFTLNGGGADIWNTSDQFNYAYQALNGDGTIIARVASQQNTDGWAKSGVMIRDSAAANGAYAFIFTTPGNGTDFQYRTTDAGSAGWSGQLGVAAPEWVKLVRSGSTFSGFTSSDGVSWTQLGSVSIGMGTTVDIGLADTGHNNGLISTATFDNVSVIPAPPAPAGLTATAGNGQVALSWTASSGAASYNLYRSTSTGTETLVQSGVSGTSFTNTGLTNGTAYFFKVAAVNAGGTSGLSNEASAMPTAPATGSIAIDAGGGAIGSFVADIDASGGAVRSTADTIATSGVANTAPMGVYQTQRYGNFTYTLPGLTPNAVYTVRLHFAEFVQNGAGKRTFSVAINGTTVLSNFDVFATAGGFEKALVEQFNAKADAGGKITIVFNNGNNNSIVSGIEVAAAKSVLINTGGTATGSLQADGFFSGGTTSSTTAAIDTSLVTNPAPQSVYQTERYGTFTYTITGLTPGANYTVRLDFAEIYWTQVGQRVFNVAINGTQVLTNFDIIAAAGAPNRAIAKTFTATADSSGDITIAFTSVANFAKISGIEIIPQ